MLMVILVLAMAIPVFADEADTGVVADYEYDPVTGRITGMYMTEEAYKASPISINTYLDEPEIIFGSVIIYGPNEFYIEGKYLYLYGIFTDPAKYDVAKAQTYLRELINGEKVECYIIAKTLDGIETAICLKDGRSINQSLVDAGFADNIAL